MAYPGLTRSGYGRCRTRARSIRCMTRLQSLAKLRVPLGGQEIELQQVDFAAGGMAMLRTRIRENSRFTIFDVDPATARQWGEALLRWSQAQPGG